jgi:hypothetical protein
VIEARLVVDLVRREMSDDVFDAPATSMARLRPSLRVEPAKMCL